MIEALSSDGSSEELILLQENLQELITLTKESLDSSKSERNNDDPLAEEYALFKVSYEFVKCFGPFESKRKKMIFIK